MLFDKTWLKQTQTKSEKVSCVTHEVLNKKIGKQISSPFPANLHYFSECSYLLPFHSFAD